MRRVDLIGPFVLVVSIGAVATCVTSGSGESGSTAQQRVRAVQQRAAAPGAPSVAPTSASDIVGLLDESSEAALTTAYQGEQVVASWRSTGTQTLTLDVAHQPGVGTVVTVPGSTPAGSAGPGVIQADAAIFDPSNSMSLLLRHYVCADAGAAEVAGRATSVVDVRRPDATGSAAGPIVARFWLDASTGLLLRREVYDASGQIVGTSRFASLTVGSPTAIAAVGAVPSASPSMLPKGWTDLMSGAQLARLRTEGWQLPAELDELTLYDARTGQVPDADHDGDDAVVQLGYSDGVSNISLFEQAGRLDPASVAGWSVITVDGYPVYEHDMLSTRMIWSGDGMVYTVVADAAPDVVRGVVEALPHGSPGPGLLTRAHRGVDRVGSWLDPFH